MITDLLTNNIHFSNEQLSWQAAITLAAKPLLEKNTINQNYIDDVIKNIEVNGSYVVLVPEIALPHAKSDNNVFETSMSFLKLNQPVLFPDQQPVTIMFFLASADSSGHLDVLVDFAEVLADQSKQSLLKAATTKKEVITVFN